MSNTAFVFVLILILGFLNRDNYGNTGIDSYDYYGITIILFTILNVAMTASNSFMEKTLKSSNMRVIFSPVPRGFIYLSKIFATFLFTSACVIINICATGWLLDVNFGGENIGYVILLLLLFDLLSSTLGVMLCCIFKSEEATNQIQSVFINIFAILGGIFFQLDGFGEFVRKLTYISPVKWMLEAVLRIIYDNDFSFFLPAISGLSVLTLIFIAICKMTFRTEDYI